MLVVVEDILGFLSPQKEDPLSIYKRICNNSYNVIPFPTIVGNLFALLSFSFDAKSSLLSVRRPRCP